MSNKALPIYEGQAHSLPKLSEGNAGLHFARFYDGYNTSFTDNDDTAKSDFLKKFAKTLGDNEYLKQYALRQMALAKAAQGDARIYALDGHVVLDKSDPKADFNNHFVTGMGNAHPVENGFQWHYTLGVPYLAGSQVKGMMRSMIERYLNEKKHNKLELLLKWFGSTDKNPKAADYQSQVGELIFFDALPYDKPTLTVDVMTPHMDKWYAEGGNIRSLRDSDKIPADWHEPVPIPFLAVKDAKFVFSIGKRANSDIDLEEVWEVLDKVLQYLGAGGKTNTGFGYMKRYIPETEMYKQLKNQEEVENWRVEKDSINGAYKQQMDAFINACRNIWYKKFKNLDKEQIAKEKACIQLLINVAEFYYSEEMAILRGKREGKVKKNKKDFLQPLLDWEQLL